MKICVCCRSLIRVIKCWIPSIIGEAFAFRKYRSRIRRKEKVRKMDSSSLLDFGKTKTNFENINRGALRKTLFSNVNRKASKSMHASRILSILKYRFCMKREDRMGYTKIKMDFGKARLWALSMVVSFPSTQTPSKFVHNCRWDRRKQSEEFNHDFPFEYERS